MSSSQFVSASPISMRLRRPLAHLGGAALGEQQIAIVIALERIEPRVLGLPFRLERLGLLEQRLRARRLARLVQGIGPGGAADHALEGVPAPVGMVDARLAHRHRLGDIAERQMQLGEIAGAARGVLPVLLRDSALQPRPHRRHRLPQPPGSGRRCGGSLSTCGKAVPLRCVSCRVLAVVFPWIEPVGFGWNHRNPCPDQVPTAASHCPRRLYPSASEVPFGHLLVQDLPTAEWPFPGASCALPGDRAKTTAVRASAATI